MSVLVAHRHRIDNSALQLIPHQIQHCLASPIPHYLPPHLSSAPIAYLYSSVDEASELTWFQTLSGDLANAALDVAVITLT